MVIWGKTPIDQFFTIYLLPGWLACLPALVMARGARQEEQRGLRRTILAVLGLGLVGTLLQMPPILFAGPIVPCGDYLWQGSVLSKAGVAPPDLFVLGLFGAAFALVLVTEVLFIHDVFGNRMNTIFKVYYQAWTLLAVGVRLCDGPASSPANRSCGPIAGVSRPRRRLRCCSWLRWPTDLQRRRARSEFQVPDQPRWARFVRTGSRRNRGGSPGCASNIPAGLGRRRGPRLLLRRVLRAAARPRLGLRGGEHGARLGRATRASGAAAFRRCSPALGPRGEEVNRLYDTTDPAEARAIMDRYEIRYVYVGFFERAGYSTGGIGSDCKAGGGYSKAGLAKFDSMMDRAFATPGGNVVIYHVAEAPPIETPSTPIVGCSTIMASLLRPVSVLRDDRPPRVHSVEGRDNAKN